MIKSKLVQYISDLPAKEKERFSQFVGSPYFNQHLKTKQLLQFLLKELGKKKPKLDRAYVFSKIFPKSPFDEQKLFNLMSNLKKLLHKYWAISHLEEHPHLEELFTLESVAKIKKFDALSNRSKQLMKHLDNQSSLSEDQYFIKYRMYNLLGEYESVYVTRTNTSKFQTMMDNLDRFYFVEKLKKSCHLIAHSINMNVQYNFSILDDIILYFQNHRSEFEADASIELYYTILMSLRNDDDPSFYQHLKKLVSDRLDEYGEDERNDLYGFSTNYCIRRINQGDHTYQLELFELYQQGLAKGILIQNGVITEWHFKNIVTLGAKLQKFDWTENFLHEHKDNLPAQHRENAFMYNLAYLYYNKGKYKEAMRTLLYVKNTDVKYYLSSSFLLLRTYYIMGDTEALLSLIDTFRIFVLRNRKMTSDQKKGYINFLRLAKKLVLLKHQYYAYSREDLKKGLDKLRQQIAKTPLLMNKEWLEQECKSERISIHPAI